MEEVYVHFIFILAQLKWVNKTDSYSYSIIIFKQFVLNINFF